MQIILQLRYNCYTQTKKVLTFMLYNKKRKRLNILHILTIEKRKEKKKHTKHVHFYSY